MEKKLAEVQQRLGTRPGLQEAEIKETLWYYYFDVNETVGWLAGGSPLMLALTNAGKYKKADTTKPNKTATPPNPARDQGRLPL